MANKIILKDNGLSGQPNSPTGYKYLGYDGETISEKTGATVSSIGGGISILSKAFNLDSTDISGLASQYSLDLGINGETFILVSIVVDYKVNGGAGISWDGSGKLRFNSTNGNFGFADNQIFEASNSGPRQIRLADENGDTHGTTILMADQYFLDMDQTIGSIDPLTTLDVTIHYIKFS